MPDATMDISTQSQADMPVLHVPRVPSSVWRMLSADTHGEKLTRGLDAAWDMGIGIVRRLTLRRSHFLKRAAAICAMDAQFSKLTDDGLREIVAVVSRAFRLGRARLVDEDRAYALIREVAYRQVGMKPHKVQVAAALAMDAGCIAELATGEGKTLVATMPATIAGWRARGCHVITVNDYLARRDVGIMKPIYDFCGLKAAYIVEESDCDERRRAYAADITYCTNKTVAADFLRDRLSMGEFRDLSSSIVRSITHGSKGVDQLVMRGLEVALIDEADSVLIDEAATPLIIAEETQSAEQTENCMRAASIAERLEANRDFVVDHRYREVMVTDVGCERIAELSREWTGVWYSSRRAEELVRQAVTARELFIRDQQYFVENGKVVIIDESTGRAMPDRSWRSGMHQAVEAKEKLEITPDRETMARISFQRFFRLYRRLCGMTGTAHEARGELWHIYHLPTVRIPTHRPVRRVIHRDRIFASADDKWRAVVDEVKRTHVMERPILIGTRSVEASEHLSRLLGEAGCEHRVINAVRHGEEADIVAQAGEGWPHHRGNEYGRPRHGYQTRRRHQ